jgi:uncharacterized protein
MTENLVFSKYNIFSRIKDSENHFIVNILTGNADILDTDEAAEMKKLLNGDVSVGKLFIDEAVAKGYLVDTSEENKLYRKKYLDFLDSRDSDEIQIFFVTNYSCNFACSYCYQDQYSYPASELSDDIVESFFSYIREKFTGRKKYITVFGGEPLLSSPKQKSIIAHFLEKAEDENLEVCFVTNGYFLDEYTEILKGRKIREIQVTLDGTADAHNKRRFLKNGSGTFDRIVNGIDLCLAASIPVNLRMVIDKENVDELVALSQFAIERGWTDNQHFKTQVGRNYELHYCQGSPDNLFTRVSLYESIYEIVKKHPDVVKFYKPAYSIAKYLSENGSLPDPLFDSCPACKTEWAFDYTGKIYSCTATVGKPGEELGTFYPSVSLDEEKVENWSSRDVTLIKECKTCNLQLACGGGCASVAKNKNGSAVSPDCRPVKELLELGFAAYF